MDISFNTSEGRFNYRVCAVAVKDSKLLTATGDSVPYFYLPGGRVQLGESARGALLREIKEETGVDSSIVRPLWFVENFFGGGRGMQTHEVSLYFLVSLPEDCALAAEDELLLTDSASGRKFTFRWVPFEKLKDIELYPKFIKENIYNLPNELTYITNDERN